MTPIFAPRQLLCIVLVSYIHVTMQNRHTIAMDGGSADYAGAVICPYILYITDFCSSTMAPAGDGQQVMDRKSKCRADRMSMSDPNKVTSMQQCKTGLALHFSPTETTQAYMETLNQQLDKHGRPVAIYSDKHSILSGGLSTQFPPDKGG